VGGHRCLSSLTVHGDPEAYWGREPPPNDRFCLVNVRKVHGRIGVRIDKIGHSSVFSRSMGDHGRCAGGETLQAGKLYVDRQSGRWDMI
jgi:hypothetical protein